MWDLETSHSLMWDLETSHSLMWDLETLKRMNQRPFRVPNGATRPVFYMAHPVTQDPVTGERSPEFFKGNVRRAIEWRHALNQLDRTRVYIAPWIAEVQGVMEGYGEVSFDEALRDDLEVVARCDGIVLTGGVITKGMQMELDHARALGLDELDLTTWRHTTNPVFDYMPPRGPVARTALARLLAEFKSG